MCAKDDKNKEGKKKYTQGRGTDMAGFGDGTKPDAKTALLTRFSAKSKLELFLTRKIQRARPSKRARVYTCAAASGARHLGLAPFFLAPFVLVPFVLVPFFFF
jgi:hypothetical protein